ncbi:unnamed protein product, partial [marine sediment metagenome]
MARQADAEAAQTGRGLSGRPTIGSVKTSRLVCVLGWFTTVVVFSLLPSTAAQF